MSNETIEERIEKIEKRNKAVEADKAWETSWSRRAAVVFLTYLFMPQGTLSGFAIHLVWYLHEINRSR